MFEPKYTISHRLLENIKRVNSLVSELNQRRWDDVVLMELEKVARAVSTYASTSIEGNPLPLTEVKRILKTKPAHIRQSEREVLNYNEVLQELDKKLRAGKIKLSLELILRIQKGVMRGLLSESDWGKLRQKSVVVNDPRSREVVFLPPDVKPIPGLMRELVEWVESNRDKIDSLILAGVFHKQMVVIHPFMDGNGRTTRLATKVLLAEMGLNTFNLFSFENYYNQNVTNYFKAVGEFGDYYELKDQIDFTAWLEYFTEGIVDELLRVGKLLPVVGQSPKTELKQYDKKMLTWIRDKGFIADRDYAKLVDRARATRALDFKRLIKLGLIERKGKGKASYYVRT
jgi:Fic family protein